MTLELDVKAPHRTVRISAELDGQPPLEIVQLDGPSVPWRGEVSDPRILASARDGIVDILLEVSGRNDLKDGEQTSTVVTWQIDSFRASFRGSRIKE